MSSQLREIVVDPATLYRLRVAAGLSRADLAHRAKLARSSITRIESGENVASSATARLLALALSVSVIELHPDYGTGLPVAGRAAARHQKRAASA